MKRVLVTAMAGMLAATPSVYAQAGMRNGSGAAGNTRTGSGAAGDTRNGSSQAGQVRTGAGQAGRIRSGAGLAGRIRTGAGLAGQIRTGSGLAGQIRTGDQLARLVRTGAGYSYTSDSVDPNVGMTGADFDSSAPDYSFSGSGIRFGTTFTSGVSIAFGNPYGFWNDWRYGGFSYFGYPYYGNYYPRYARFVGDGYGLGSGDRLLYESTPPLELGWSKGWGWSEEIGLGYLSNGVFTPFWADQVGTIVDLRSVRPIEGYSYATDGDRVGIYRIGQTGETARPIALETLPPLARARLLLVEDRASQAIEAYREHLADEPGDAFAFREAGLALLLERKFTDGVSAIREAYRIDPSLVAEPLDEDLIGTDAVRSTLQWTVLRAHDYDLSSGWLSAAMLMQTRGDRSPAGRMISRAAEAGLENEILRAWDAVLGTDYGTVPTETPDGD